MRVWCVSYMREMSHRRLQYSPEVDRQLTGSDRLNDPEHLVRERLQPQGGLLSIGLEENLQQLDKIFQSELDLVSVQFRNESAELRHALQHTQQTLESTAKRELEQRREADELRQQLLEIKRQFEFDSSRVKEQKKELERVKADSERERKTLQLNLQKLATNFEQEVSGLHYHYKQQQLTFQQQLEHAKGGAMGGEGGKSNNSESMVLGVGMSDRRQAEGQMNEAAMNEAAMNEALLQQVHEVTEKFERDRALVLKQQTELQRQDTQLQLLKAEGEKERETSNQNSNMLAINFEKEVAGFQQQQREQELQLLQQVSNVTCESQKYIIPELNIPHLSIFVFPRKDTIWDQERTRISKKGQSVTVSCVSFLEKAGIFNAGTWYF